MSNADGLRLEILLTAMLDFAEEGTRHDLMPTVHSGWNVEDAYRYIQSMDDYVRQRAATALAAMRAAPSTAEEDAIKEARRLLEKAVAAIASARSLLPESASEKVSGILLKTTF